MGDRIRDIRERFDEISRDRERLHLKEEDGERRVLKAPYPAPTSHMVDESSIYGREGDKQEVLDLLFSEGVGNGVSVIPIVGKGGLGKTTIAQQVYNDPNIQEYFDLTGWVCVSDDFDVPRLTKAIIETLTRSSCDLAQLSTLQDILKEKLKGKRVLLVLDDVWNDQQSRWESLRNPFVGAEMVTIIMTCRNDSVAEIMQTVRPYQPHCLSPEQSWSLFRHYAFGGRDPEEQPRLVDIGKQIVKKCSGLPLAVKSIGSFLRYTADEDSWMDVIQSDIWEVDGNNEILPALRLSYSRMPAYLKPCFIYCSMFPKDYVFDKKELVRLWMAQGYIQTSGGRKRMEDIGDEYCNDLQRRSFFDSYWSKFKMHDMIHDLAKSIAANECWAIVDKKLPGLPDEVRHLYVQVKEKFVKLPCSYNFSTLRTLLIQYWYGDHIAITEIIKNLPLLRCLRTLQFCWKIKDEIPDLLGNLKHLRYLRISSDTIEKVPESIYLLYHLQILFLNCPNLAELPDGLDNLINLRYLDITSNKIEKLSKSICLLYHLQTLILYCPNVAELPDGLGKLINLRYLSITSNKIENLSESICPLYHLQTLERYCWNLAELPDGLGNLINLRYLAITSNKIEKLPESIGLLYHLQTLKLYCPNVVELPDGLGNLINLRYLGITSNKIKKLPKSICLLYHLQTLILYCPNVVELPDGLGNLTNLHHLQIGNQKILCLLAGVGKLTKLQSFLGYYKVKGGIGVLKNLVNLQTLIISGLRNMVNIEDVRNAGLKYMHRLEKLFLHWNVVDCKHDPHHNSLLHLEAFSEKNKDVPANEKREEAMLEHLQPHANLKKLVIKGYGGSKFPEWVGNPFSFASLQKIRIINCKKIRSLPLYIHDSLGKLDAPISKSMLERVSISDCRQLTSIAGLHHLHSLKDLKIKNCPQLRLLSEEVLPSKLQVLHIEKCQQLTSLSGTQYVTSLRRLIIKNCPKLQIIAEDQLSSVPYTVKIVDCPGLSNWCQIQRINCIQVASGNKLTLSNTWENIMSGFDDLTSIEYLCFSNSWKCFLETDFIPVLEELMIWGCTKIPPLWFLPMLASLRSLVIKDCPGIQFLLDELLPSTLESLVVDSCEDLSVLMLVQQNRDAFKELQLVNCPMLALVEGSNWLFFPKILRIERCPRLWLPQDDRQPSIPPRVEIAEKIENKETIDDGTQEKQMLDCLKTKHANSAEPSQADNNVVSPISDDATDCNMGQFLHLGFPSGCSSQSSN